MDIFIVMALSIMIWTLLTIVRIMFKNDDEYLRPMIGMLLFRKPKIPIDLGAEKVFEIGNHHQPIKTKNDLEYSNDRLQKYIKEKSWFKRRDRIILSYHFKEVQLRLEEDAEREARKRQTEYSEWMRRQKAWEDLFGEFSMPNKSSGWRKVLGVPADCCDPKVIKTSYRKLVSKDHPDKGGTGKRMPELNRALDTARNELNFV